MQNRLTWHSTERSVSPREQAADAPTGGYYVVTPNLEPMRETWTVRLVEPHALGPMEARKTPIGDGRYDTEDAAKAAAEQHAAG